MQKQNSVVVVLRKGDIIIIDNYTLEEIHVMSVEIQIILSSTGTCQVFVIVIKYKSKY